jgi:hypothetical protein
MYPSRTEPSIWWFEWNTDMLRVTLILLTWRIWWARNNAWKWQMGFNPAFVGLTTVIRSEKCVVRRFRRSVNVIECIYTNLESIAYYTPRLYGIAYCSLGYKSVQHVTVLNTVGNCNTMVLYYSIIILCDHRRLCGPSLTETSDRILM